MFVIAETINHFYLKLSKKRYFICNNFKNKRIGRSIWEYFIKDNIDEHEPTRKVYNRGNQFITTAQTNTNIYSNKLIKFAETFTTIIVIDKTISTLT